VFREDPQPESQCGTQTETLQFNQPQAQARASVAMPTSGFQFPRP